MIDKPAWDRIHEHRSPRDAMANAVRNVEVS